MREVIISDRKREFGRNSLLWRDSDEVWRQTKPSPRGWTVTNPAEPFTQQTVVFPVRRRTLKQRFAEAWEVFWYD